MKKRQQCSIGSFVVAIVTILVLQVFLSTKRVETLGYSQFKTLAQKGLVSDLVITNSVIQGNLKTQALKDALSQEWLSKQSDEVKNGKQLLAFSVVRVEDPELVPNLEKAGVSFKGEISSEGLMTHLSWLVPVAIFFLLTR